MPLQRAYFYDVKQRMWADLAYSRCGFCEETADVVGHVCFHIAVQGLIKYRAKPKKTFNNNSITDEPTRKNFYSRGHNGDHTLAYAPTSHALYW